MKQKEKGTKYIPLRCNSKNPKSQIDLTCACLTISTKGKKKKEKNDREKRKVKRDKEKRESCGAFCWLSFVSAAAPLFSRLFFLAAFFYYYYYFSFAFLCPTCFPFFYSSSFTSLSLPVEGDTLFQPGRGSCSCFSIYDLKSLKRSVALELLSSSFSVHLCLQFFHLYFFSS